MGRGDVWNISTMKTLAEYKNHVWHINSKAEQYDFAQDLDLIMRNFLKLKSSIK